MPFLCMRLYVIFGRKQYDRMLLFFTAKNSIMFMLEIYVLGRGFVCWAQKVSF